MHLKGLAIKKLALIIGLFFAALPASATTLYMAGWGSDTTGNGTPGTPYATLSKCMSLLSVGQNTIIVGTGTYASGFTMDSSLVAGTSWSTYLTIQAQADFGVRVTQTNALNMATSKTYFMLVRGIIFDGNYQKSVTGASAYFFRCGFEGGATTGNVSNLQIGTNDFGPPGANDMTFEECFMLGRSTGSARYQALIYNANNILLRKCILHQGSGWDDGGSENPSAEMVFYNSTNVAAENCFAIDGRFGDVPDTYQAQFYAINNSGQPQTGNTIALYGSGAFAGAGYGLYFDNTIAYSSFTVKDFFVVDSSNSLAGGFSGNVGLLMDGFTFIRSSYTASGGFAINYGSAGSKTMRNGIVSGWSNGLSGNASPIAYVDWFNSGTAPTITGRQTYDPKSNGLQYFPRIEVGSNLKTAGLNSGQMGAQITNQFGYTFTRYGVNNYNVLTSTPLWPFPNEAIIKQEFCGAYNWGFCSAANPTLTDYLHAYTTSPYNTSSGGTSGSTQTVTFGVASDTVTVSSPRIATFIDLYGLFATTTSVYNECAAAKTIGIGFFSGNHDWWSQVQASSGAALSFTLVDAMVAVTTGIAAGQCASDMLLEAPIAASWTPGYVATTTVNPYTSARNSPTRYPNSNMGLLGTYVYQFVSHYPAGTFKAIDTAREPDNPNFWLGANSTYPVVGEYAHQIATVSVAAKTADPTITVVCGHIAFPVGNTLQGSGPSTPAGYAAAYPGHYYLNALLAQTLVPGVTQYCDVWALDYFRGAEGGNTTLLQSISSMTTVLANYGVTSPRIWVTEYAKEGVNFYVSTNTALEEQLKANYLYQDYAVAFSTGVEKMFYQTFSGLDYSLTDADLNPHPVYYCLGNFFTFLNGYSYGTNLDNGTLSGRRWSNGTSRRFALWTVSGATTYSFGSPMYKGYLSDITGSITTIPGSSLYLYPVTTNAFLMDILPPASFYQGLNIQGLYLR